MMKTAPRTRKLALAALLLAAMLFLTGCNLVVKDPEVDAKQVILTVNGEAVNKEEFTLYFDNALNRAYEEQLSFQQTYGLPPQPIDEDAVLEATLDSTAKDKLLHQKAHELGLDALTEEEEKALEEKANQDYETLLQQVQLYYFMGSPLESEELRAALEEQAKELGLTRELYLESARESNLHEKLHEYAEKDVVVSEEEITASYDTKVQTDKDAYTAAPANYETAVNNGQPVYYAPAGYRYVRQLLIQFEQKDQDLLLPLQNEVAPLQNAVDQAQAAVERYNSLMASESIAEADQPFVDEQHLALGEEAARYLELVKLASPTAEETAELEALKAKLPVFTALQAAQDALAPRLAELDAALEIAYQNIQAKVDEVYALAAAPGADFEALITQYNQDPGQPARGYLVSQDTTRFVPEFTQGAMQLAQVGDVSQPIKTSYGFHILRYNEEVPEGPVALDSVKAALEEELKGIKAEEIYHEMEETWLGEATIVKYPERFKN